MQSKRKADDEPEPEVVGVEAEPGPAAADAGAGDEDMGVSAGAAAAAAAGAAADSEGPAGAGAGSAAAPATDSVAFGLAAGEAELEMPWVEKYRPRVLADVIGNEEAVKRLAVIAEEGNMPNLILSVRGVPSLRCGVPRLRMFHEVGGWGMVGLGPGLWNPLPPKRINFARAKSSFAPTLASPQVPWPPAARLTHFSVLTWCIALHGMAL